MTCPRLWIALVLAAAALGGTSPAQQSSGGSQGSGGSSGSSGSGAAQSGGNAPASADEGAASAFGTPSGGTAPPAPKPATSPTPTPEPAPTPGTGGVGGGGATPPPEAATPFTLPGNFGGPSETLRLTRPRFRFTGAFAVGFDDNIFGTPTKQQEFPEQRVTVLIRPEQIVQVPVFEPGFVGGIRTPVLVGFRNERQPAVTEEIVIPGQKTEPRESSIVARTNVGLEVTFSSRRTAFTLDTRLGAEYTAAREKEPTQYFGSLGLRFVHKLAPRLQWNGSVDGSYSQQPDFSRANTPTTVTTGSYLNLIARTGLEYRWTPRLTTAASLGYNSLTFSDSTEQSNDYQAFTYSTEARYLISPRLTVLGEGRYSTTSYANNLARDSSTSFLLGGANWIVTNRLTSAFRAGVAIRDTETGGSSLSPYMEMNLGYKLARASQLQYTMQYGFEEPVDSSSEVVTFRNGLSYIQYFTPRLRAVASGNLVYSTTSNTTTDDSTTQLAFDTNLGLEYNLNRRWTFTGTYSFTTVFSDNEFAEYYRNRLFLGLQFAF